MNRTIYINTEKICKIYIREIKAYSGTWNYKEFRPERRWFLNLLRRTRVKPAGWYYLFDDDYRTTEQMLEQIHHLFLQDGILMLMAEVKFVFVGLDSVFNYFKTNEEAQEFVDGIISKYNLKLEPIRMIN